MANQSDLEAAFALWLRQNPEIPEPTPEYVFAPPRKWRFDFAWPEHKFAVEVEGLIYGPGRHQSIEGFAKDGEKYEAAMLLGWTVYRVPGPWIMSGDRYVWRPQVMSAIRIKLGLEEFERSLIELKKSRLQTLACAAAAKKRSMQ